MYTIYIYVYIYIHTYYNDMQNMCIVCVAGPSKIRELSLCSPPARWGLLDFMSVAWSSSSSSSSSSRCPPRPPAQLRLAIHSVLCRTSTTTIHAQCSLPDLNHDHPRPVFPAGPQPRPSTPSVPCRTSTGRGWSWLRSGREHWAWMVVVEVRQGTPRVSTPKDMPHRVPEDMPDRMLEDMPDRMPEGMPDRMPDRMSARMPEDMPDKVPECLPDRMPADLPDNMPEDMLDRMPDGMPEDLPDNMPEDMPDRMPDGMPEDMPEHMPEDMPEDMPEHLPEDMPEHLPEDMPGRMPEDMPDRMPDRMPENMSDRMPEDLPVTKCINVMVGITRSKVIFFTNSWLRKSRWLRLKMFLTGASHPCLPLRLEALEAANAGESQR